MSGDTRRAPGVTAPRSFLLRSGTFSGPKTISTIGKVALFVSLRVNHTRASLPAVTLPLHRHFLKRVIPLTPPRLRLSFIPIRL